MLSNPPFGVTWGGKDGYEAEARKLKKTRYQAGMPRVNDGALLFLQTMLAKMKPAGQGREPHRHHLQRLAALQRRLRLRRERDPPLDPGERLARRHRHAARPALLQHRHLHLHLAAAKRQARLAQGPRDADRRPPAIREGAQVLRQQAQPHHRRPPRLDRGALPRRLEEGLRRRAGEDLPARGLRLPQGQRRLLAVRRARPAGDRHRALREGLHRRESEKGAGVLRQRADLPRAPEGREEARRRQTLDARPEGQRRQEVQGADGGQAGDRLAWSGRTATT